jgi:hypothetical protein
MLDRRPHGSGARNAAPGQETVDAGYLECPPLFQLKDYLAVLYCEDKCERRAKTSNAAAGNLNPGADGLDQFTPSNPSQGSASLDRSTPSTQNQAAQNLDQQVAANPEPRSSNTSGSDRVTPIATANDTAGRTQPEGAGDGKAQYDALIRKADQQGDPAQATPALRNLLNALDTGTVQLADGTMHTLSANERVHAHQLALGLIESMQARSLVRQNYSLYLKAIEQYGDAETQLKDSKAAADAVPYDLVTKEQNLLLKDAQNTDLDPTTQMNMDNAAKHLNSVSEWPLLVRYLMANFYLGGGVDDHGQPNVDAVAGPGGIIKAHTKVLQPDKAQAVLKEIADIQKKNGLDVMSHPTLDPSFAGLWNLTRINSPEMLKEEMDKQTSHAHALWSRAIATAAGVVATALIARYAGITSAKEFLSVGGALAMGGGFATATATDYGVQHAVFGEKDFSLKQAALQGGGTYLVVESALLAKNLIVDAKAGTITPEVTGQQIFQNLQDKSLAGLAKVFDANNVVKPDALIKAIEAAGGMEKAASTALTTEQITALVSRSGLNAAGLLRALFPGAKAVAGAATDAELAGTSGEALDATNGTRAVDATASGEAAAAASATAGGDAGQIAATGRDAALTAGTAAGAVSDTAIAADSTAASSRAGFISSLYDKLPHPIEAAKSFIADMRNPELVFSPLKELSPNHIPTFAEINALRLTAGVGAALTYQTGMDLENGAISQSLGEVDQDGKKITPMSTLTTELENGSFIQGTARNAALFYFLTKPDISYANPRTGKRLFNWAARQTEVRGGTPTFNSTLKTIGGAALYPALTSSSTDIAHGLQFQSDARRYQFLIDLERQPVQNVSNPPEK